jgi:phosphoribosylformylglycinamidine synthase subunit PurQ / glutaminase
VNATTTPNGTPARIGVITFPGTLDDVDAARAVRHAGAQPVALWHAEDDLRGVDAVVVPGGFSYGDYLRAGAIASHQPILRAVVDAARRGTPVLGICNGFQILCEAGLLPGALVRNAGLHFVCRDQRLRVEHTGTAWTSRYAPGTEIVVPLKSGEGRYVADAATLAELEDAGRVVFRYVGGAPNGAVHDIAGIASADGRVVGLMPHPEHAIDPLTGPSADGLPLFRSAIDAILGAVPATRE